MINFASGMVPVPSASEHCTSAESPRAEETASSASAPDSAMLRPKASQCAGKDIALLGLEARAVVNSRWLVVRPESPALVESK